MSKDLNLELKTPLEPCSGREPLQWVAYFLRVCYNGLLIGEGGGHAGGRQRR
jgi:hypothetical protein